MTKALSSLNFQRGPDMKNRFMLAPLTNSQSHEDGIMSEEEFHWLTMRAKGGFGLTMTCAAHVQAIGKGFPGQLGFFSDKHLEGLTRLAKEIKSHGYILCQFLSGEVNLRDDEYGGSFENRNRLLKEIIEGVRSECRDDFMLGVRISSERFGILLSESKALAEDLMTSGDIDFLDMSLWDCFKEPQEEEFKGKTLIQHFCELDRGTTRLGVAGNLRTPQDVTKAMEEGVDWIMLGRAAILHHNFPILYEENDEFTPSQIPVSVDYLTKEGLSPKFIEYMSNWGFVDGSVDLMKEAIKKA